MDLITELQQRKPNVEKLEGERKKDETNRSCECTWHTLFFNTSGDHLQHRDNIVHQSRSAIHLYCVDLSGRLQDSSWPLHSKHGHAGKQVGRSAKQGELELHS